MVCGGLAVGRIEEEKKQQIQLLEMWDAFGGIVILFSERQRGHFEGIVEPRQGGGGVAKSQSSLMTPTLLERHCELNRNEFSVVVFSQTLLELS